MNKVKPSKSVSTGKKDAKGRIIFKGPRGGLFCIAKGGKKVQPTNKK